MIISKTPLRISFAGGGSDFPAFYREFGGAVLSSSIDKYIYININKKFDYAIRLAYSENEDVMGVDEIRHPIIRESLKYLGIAGGLEITTIADIPSKGTGLGSSSSFTVGLLNALNAFQGSYISKPSLASESCYVEIIRCGSPIGKQDQYAAAFGGLNLIEFKQDDTVVVQPIICSLETVESLESNCLIFYTGITRNASEILLQQSSNLSDKKIYSIKRMVDLTYQLAKDLRENNLCNLGDILDEGWRLKSGLSKDISNSEIDYWYRLAKQSGAKGGKILGAGAGGFLLLYASPESHAKVRLALSMLREVKVKFERTGSQIIYYN